MHYNLNANFENMSRGEIVAHIGMVKAELRDKHSALEVTKHREYIKGRRFQIEQILDIK